MKIFVDTCVWRYWLTLQNSRPIDGPLKESAIAFNKIYREISSHPDKHSFLYNTRIEDELPDDYLRNLPICFKKIITKRFVQKIPIPLSRADGTYKYDGSILCGGKLGGFLREILSMDGYDHETALKNAKPNLKLENPAHTNPRKNEFDVEHLESALEANADLFITADQALINRLRHALQLHPENSIIEMANKICGTPFQALIRLEATFS